MKKVKIKNPDARLVTVCTLRDAVEAEMVKNTLLDHGIECQITDEHQAGFTGTFDVGVLVRESDAENAKEFMRIHHPHIFGKTG